MSAPRDDRLLNQARARIIRRHASNVDAAGNQVGPNDADLSSRLWACAADLNTYADAVARGER